MKKVRRKKKINPEELRAAAARAGFNPETPPPVDWEELNQWESIVPTDDETVVWTHDFERALPKKSNRESRRERMTDFFFLHAF